MASLSAEEVAVLLVAGVGVSPGIDEEELPPVSGGEAGEEGVRASTTRGGMTVHHREIVSKGRKVS